MAGEEPTLQQGDASDDRWVEYLQALLVAKGVDGAQYWTPGVFDSVTKGCVLSLQQDKGLKQDGIVGHQTWAALQDEDPVPGPGDDGRAPHTYVEKGVEVRFTEVMAYLPSMDSLSFQLYRVGTEKPTADQLRTKVTIYLPGSDQRELTANLDVEMDPIYELSARDVTGGVAGEYEVVVELSQEVGSGERKEFSFDRS